MRVAFRQGIIDYQQDGGIPQFIQPGTLPGYLSLNVSPTPTIITVAHRESNYLLRFDSDVSNAWGPLQPGVPNHLYWEVDLVDGQVKYGITTLGPVVSAEPPPSPQVDQHWFDLSTTTMRVWKGTSWVETARLFAATCPLGTTSTITARPLGSQVGLTTSAQAGYILFDTIGRPVRGVGLQLLTSATPVRMRTSVGTSGVLVSQFNTSIWARAAETMPAFTLVYFSGEGQISRASGHPAFVLTKTPVGIVTEDLSLNEAGAVTQYGEISWDGWDWTGHIGRPLYCSEFGELTLVRPGGLMVYRVGFVVGQKSILFQIDAETHQEVPTSSTGNVVISGNLPVVVPPPLTNLMGEKVFTISVQEASAAQPGYMSAAKVIQLNDHETRLDSIEAILPLKSDVGHNHDTLYAPISHNHNTLYAPISHNHDTLYAPIAHNHDSLYAPIVHNHDSLYAPIVHNHDSLYAPIAHNHTPANIVSTPSQAGYVLVATGISSQWQPLPTSSVNSLDDLSDVVVGTPRRGQVLMYVGTRWENADPAPWYQEFTAAAGQTQFDTDATIVRTLPRTATRIYLQVFVNGVLQLEGASKAYTVTGTNQITFNAGLELGDEVIIYSWASPNNS